MTDNHHSIALLDERALISVSGPDAARFLQNVITTDIDHVRDGDMMPGALLSPQGKVLFDFLVGVSGGVFHIDTRRDAACALRKRLGFYKLRADIEIHKEKQAITRIFMDSALLVEPQAEHQDAENCSNMLIFKDKRFINEYSLIRKYWINSKRQPIAAERQKWDMIRITNGIAESGADFEPGSVFPHDINYDQINGISFKKGCYIGQEVISRMQHRGTARRRVLVATGARPLPPAGTAIEADGKPVGVLGTVAGVKAIALARIDKISALVQAGAAVCAQGVPLTFSAPANARFSLSGPPAQN